MEYTDYFSDRDPGQLTLFEGQLTYTCNIRCAYCFNPHHKRGDELSTDEWKRVIQQAAHLGAKAAVFNGGEPLGRKDCIEIIHAAHETGMQTAISTNGLLLTNEILRSLASSLNVLQISIHPWRYLDNLRSGIDEFSTYIKKFKEYGGRSAVFNIVLFKGGLLPKLEELLHLIVDTTGTALDSIGIQAANPYGHGFLNPDSIPSMAECEAAHQIIVQCQQDLPIRIQDSVSQYFIVKPNVWGAWGCIVSPSGDVYPMIEGADSLAYLFREMQFDNIRARSLQDIWEHSAILNMYRGTSWLQQPCTTCRYKEECRGGSRMNAFVLTGDMKRADPFCNVSPDHKLINRFYRHGELTVLNAGGARP
jgi:pyrroloquinoline quinone biosynthesis protein E